MPTAQLTASDLSLRLSDTADVTLTVSGPAPLRVALPRELLAPGSAAVWQITPVGPVSLSADGTNWAQSFRLSPFVPGETVPMVFNPITVNGTEVTPNSLSFKITTSIRNPSPDDARPVTGIEQLPPNPASDAPMIVAGVSLTLALSAVLVVVLVVARRRKVKPLSPNEWARTRIGGLRSAWQSGRLTDAAFVGELADVFREYLSRRFGMNTEQKTTAELLGSTEEVWDDDTRAEVGRVLAACDAVKFAGHTPTPGECDDLSESVDELVTGWEISPTPPLSSSPSRPR